MFDDLTGDEGEDIETVEVTYRGATIEMELSAKHREELIGLILPYVRAGRRREKACGKCGHRLRSVFDDELRDALGEDLPASLLAAERPAASATLWTEQRNSKADLEKVRAFAHKYGIKIGNGRVPEDVWSAWADNENLSLLKKGRLPRMATTESAAEG